MHRTIKNSKMFFHNFLMKKEKIEETEKFYQKKRKIQESR